MEDAKFNKLLNNKYHLLQDIAKKYDYSEELLAMITYIYLSFYMDFGIKCDDALYDLFNKVRIYYDQGTVQEVALKNGLGDVPSSSAAVTIFTPNLDVFKNTTLKQNPQIIVLGTKVNQYVATPALKLEMLMHEVRHALMGYYHTNFLCDENTYYMRSGLQETYYIRNQNIRDKIDVKQTGIILDEVTNTYITELLLNRILSLKKYKVENSSLRSYLASIKTSQPDGRYLSLGYSSEVRLLYPLLLNEMFINLVNQHQFDGDIDIVKEFVNINTDLCDFQEFSQLLDYVSSNNSKYPEEAKNGNLEFVQMHAKNIGKVKSIVLDLRKNIDGTVSN